MRLAIRQHQPLLIFRQLNPIPSHRSPLYVYGVEFKQRVESVAELVVLHTLDPRLTLAEVEMDLGTRFYDERSGRLYVHCTDSRTPDQQRMTVLVTNACGIKFMSKNGIRHIIVDG